MTAPQVPEDWPVQPIIPGGTKPWAPGIAQCGTCGRYWDDSVSTSLTPVPGARCPFEAFHEDPEDDEVDLITVRRSDVVYVIDALLDYTDADDEDPIIRLTEAVEANQ